MTKTFLISANGTDMGEYAGATEQDAIDAYASDAGYENFADLLRRVPGATREEVSAVEIDTAGLFSAVEKAAGQPAFQDSYGEGVAMVDGISYATYREMAYAFDIDIDQHTV